MAATVKWCSQAVKAVSVEAASIKATATIVRVGVDRASNVYRNAGAKATDPVNANASVATAVTDRPCAIATAIAGSKPATAALSVRALC